QIHEPVRDVRAIPEGHSGFTYWIELDGRRAVLRLPPPNVRIAGPADIPRQARLMAALHAQGVPVPAILSASSEPVVAARPFMLMEAVDGKRIEETLAAGIAPIQCVRSAIEVLRRLQAVPIAQTGIGDEAAMPLTGELARWAWLMERAPEELTGRAPRLRARLAERMPAEQAPVMMHGDYHFGNMLFRDGRVVAVLDWEIAQIGQPVLDPACLAVVARAQGGDDAHPGRVGGWDVLIEDVRDLAGSGDAFPWALALTYYKYAAIFGYNLMLHRRGKRPDPSYEQRTDTILRFIDEGIALLG
ncbi:MAG TPA: phosphotransferase family protein, partial [Candidatus Limnocylindrales bacterium]|nr:phosphotransferase family protein [Candidatus Limnocylindrales bacterium]